MSVRRSRSWASVVANGIVDEPMEVLSVKPLKGAKSLSSSPPSAPPLTTSNFPPIHAGGLKKSMDREPDVDSQSYVKSSEETNGYNSKFDYQSKANFQRPYRNNWPRNPGPFPDHRHFHGSNNQGVFYRPRRPNYSTTYYHPRYPQQQPRGPRPYIKHQYAKLNNAVEPERFFAPKYYSKVPPMPTPLNMEPTDQPGQPMNQANEWEQPSSSPTDGSKENGSQWQSSYDSIDMDQSNKEDSNEKQSASVSPLAHPRCQITFTDSTARMVQWDTISRSRRVWEPLDMMQRGSQDPSNPMPPLPPGFEHVVPGKRALCGRTRKLLGEHVEFEVPRGYSTPLPITMPELELREQQHFIAKHDTHLSCRKVQLKVTNGATGDGYYVRPITKLLPNFTKMPSQMKFQTSYQSDGFNWESVNCKRDKDEVNHNHALYGEFLKPTTYQPLKESNKLN